MKRTKLQADLDQLFAFASEAAMSHQALDDLAETVSRAEKRFKSRMRVAFIGGVNKGKSTLMNAFLGEKLAETGNKELTCSVTWFRYGEQPELRVHRLDGGTEESFASLAELTTRCDGNSEFLDQIRFVEARLPCELLKHFDLIDTPGLYSAKGKNSEITRRFLTDEETKPHAVVFLFCEALKVQDIKELEEFQSLDAGSMTGINAIGALTKAESLTNGFESGRQIIQQIADNHPWTLRRFYTILPVAGQSAFGAQTVKPNEEDALRTLAALPAALTTRMLEDARDFRTKAFSPETPAEAVRLDLYERLGLWGIGEAIRLIRAGRSLSEVRDHLMAASNLEKLRQLVISHFGNRAQLIQAAAALQTVHEAAFYRGQQLSGSAQEAAHAVVREVDRIKMSEPRFFEFGILESYYRGEFDLGPNDLAQLLDVTGEHGNACAQRLGSSAVPPASQLLVSIQDLINVAHSRESYWRARASDWLVPEVEKRAFRTLADSNAGIHVRLLEALKHVRTASELLNWDL